MAFQIAAPALAELPDFEAEEEAHFVSLVFDEPSEYGECNSYIVDENGELMPEPNLIPEPQDRLDAVLPSSYDLRDYNRVTSAKSQGDTGTCWAHSAMAVAESALITDGLADTSLDLSEAHLVWFSQGQAPAEDDILHNDINPIGAEAYIPGGGNIYTSRGALASWMGADYEANYDNVTQQPVIDESARYNSAFHLQKSVMFDATDTDSIKAYLMENGALTISYYYSDAGELVTSEYTSYYQSNATTTNHAVTLIGWDDNFSKDNFATAAPGNGAWLLKNSWSSYYGDNGCFYLSYYDTSINNIASLELEKNTNYSSVYQYDVFSGGGTYYKGTGITAANMFTAVGSDPLAAVSFYTNTASTDYIIRIYSGVEDGNPASGTLMHTQTGTAAYAGYHTIPLNKTVPIASGTKFSVAVTLENPDSVFWFDTNSDSEGQSYYTWGTGTSSSVWNDVYIKKGTNACIKAFTKSEGIAKPIVTATPGNGQVTLTWDAVPGATAYAISIYEGGAYNLLTSSETGTSYTVTGLTNGKTYEFLVQAFVGGGWTTFTTADHVSCTPVGSVITKPSPKATPGNGQITLTWDAVPGATAYAISIYEGGAYNVLTSSETGTSYTVTGLTNGKTYEFLVQAFVGGNWTVFTTADHVSCTPNA